MISDSVPKTYHEKTINILGIFKFSHTIEDRRPDLNVDHVDDCEKIKNLGYKYKHIFVIQFLWIFQYCAIIKSINPGIIWIDGQEI